MLDRRLFVVLLCAGAALSACSSSGSSSTTCPTIVPAGPQLLYPIPGATDVPTSAARIFVAGVPLVSTSLLVPTSGGGAETITTAPFAAIPSSVSIPTPAATPRGTAPVYAAAYGTLAAHTTYSVSYPPEISGKCTLPIASSGSFTTQ